MTHSQWVSVLVRNFTRTKTLQLKAVTIGAGKLYVPGNQHSINLEPNTINNTEIRPNKSYTLAASGRNWGFKGCNGSFEVWAYKEPGGVEQEKVCKVVYDCPQWSSNIFNVLEQNSKFKFSGFEEWKTEGALGKQTVDIEEH